MTFDQYKRRALLTAEYPHLDENLVYPALGLVGEAGEVAEKIKKHWRKTGELNPVLTLGEKVVITNEMGDVLWYLAALCHELGISFDAVAMGNLDKLKSRKARNVIKGEGDDR